MVSFEADGSHEEGPGERDKLCVQEALWTGEPAGEEEADAEDVEHPLDLEGPVEAHHVNGGSAEELLEHGDVEQDASRRAEREGAAEADKEHQRHGQPIRGVEAEEAADEEVLGGRPSGAVELEADGDDEAADHEKGDNADLPASMPPVKK